MSFIIINFITIIITIIVISQHAPVWYISDPVWRKRRRQRRKTHRKRRQLTHRAEHWWRMKTTLYET